MDGEAIERNWAALKSPLTQSTSYDIGCQYTINLNQALLKKEKEAAVDAAGNTEWSGEEVD